MNNQAVGTIVDEAINYGQRGWRVFPAVITSQNKKFPAVKGWKEKAACEALKIKELFTGKHTAIGMATGKSSGVTVIDVDMKDGKNGFLTLEKIGRAHV